VNDPTDHPVVSVVRDLIVETLGGRLVGLYVFGSITRGDFEPDLSDVDLIAVLSDSPNDQLTSALREMHARVDHAAPEWKDRVEVDYVSARGLAECRTARTTIARISPGEPLHLIDAGRGSVLDRYPARRDGIALVGPAIESFVPPIPEAEYLVEVRRYLASLRTGFDDDASAGSHAYTILTMCRGLYLTSGECLSKREAALRARHDFPRWERLIEVALAWRDQMWDVEQPDVSGSVTEVRAFIDDMADRLQLT
jgi:predicted nucleotidyltransferase